MFPYAKARLASPVCSFRPRAFEADIQTPKEEATQSLAELGTILFARQKGGTRTGSRSTIGSCAGYGDFALLTRPWDGLLEAAVDSSRHLLETT